MPRLLVITVLLWFAGALAVSGAGLIARLMPPWPQVILFALVAAQCAAYFLIKPARHAIERIDIQWLIGFHLSRFVGFYFLWLYDRGRLPFDFAVIGGWGDILIACGAVVLLVAAPLRNHRGVLAIWNLFGLMDILFVVTTAVRLVLTDASSMHELFELPLVLLPTFVVPIIIATHVLIFSRLLTARRL